MKNFWIGGLVLLALAPAYVAVFSSQGVSAREEAKPEKGATTGPRDTVVETEGHNLLVTDNQSDTLYFYTIDKDAKIGSDLKLRCEGRSEAGRQGSHQADGRECREVKRPVPGFGSPTAAGRPALAIHRNEPRPEIPR